MVLWAPGSYSSLSPRLPGSGASLQSGLVTVVEGGTEVQKRKGNRGQSSWWEDPGSEDCLQEAGCSPSTHWPGPSSPHLLPGAAAGRKAGVAQGPTLHAAVSSHPHPVAYLGLSWYQARGR